MEIPEISGTIWFEWRGPKEIIGATPRNDNFALLAALPIAMRRGCALHVRGIVDPTLLASAERYTRIWSQWRPDKYKPAKLSADREIPDIARQGTQPWIYPFSGGVDSMFSIFANSAGDAGRDTHVPGSVFLVRGFDYPLSDTKSFPILEQRVRSVAQLLKVPMLVCSTNWKEFCIQYELDTQLGLAAIAHTLAATHAGVSIAADFTYGEDLRIMPWGNNQYMPHLLGSSGFHVAGGGAEALRVDKIAYLSKIPNALEMISICQTPSGEENRLNCEKCEKCVRTALGLYVATGRVEPTFVRKPSAFRIFSLPHLSLIEVVFWSDILVRMPARDWAYRWSIKFLIARSQMSMRINAVLQPAEKRYLRPLHAYLRRKLGAEGRY
ncbi:MAG: hypothetical protein JSS54_11830 [Proteobacteria bacterium]|nr:hypothetical protein [Pseudomonadota bacterium]